MDGGYRLEPTAAFDSLNSPQFFRFNERSYPFAPQCPTPGSQKNASARIT